MKIIDFFKSLVLPSKMERYRNMSAIISLIIFVLATYLVAMPYGKYLAEGALEYKKEYNFLALQELEVTEENETVINEILSYGCSVNETGILNCTGLNDGDVKGKEDDKLRLTYVKDGITKRINIFFDYYGTDGTATYNLSRGFPLNAPAEGEENPNPNPVYPYEDKVEDYFLVFTKTNIFYQALPIGIDQVEPKIKHNDVELSMVGLNLDYKQYLPNFSFVDLKADNFGPYVINSLMDGFSEYARSTSFFQTFLITLGFPLLMVLLFWLFFRKNGRLKRFKEYYNIAAISSILPVLIIFGVSWFYSVVLSWYVFIFSIFYLFILFKINNAVKQEVEIVQSY